MSDLLLAKIDARSARIVVIGAGYVGLPLCLALCDAGFEVLALERAPDRLAQLRRGISYSPDVTDARLGPAVRTQRLVATDDPAILSRADAVIVCVPTPLGKSRAPDLSMLREAVESIAERARPGQLVVVESTTYPGATAELVVPILTRSGLQLGRDLFVAFSPERIDPGNREWRLENTPKVLGGSTPACLAVARALYSTFVETLVPVSSTGAAEMVKLLENTFRAVNIALVNELALASRRLGLDVREVIEAASTKPFGYLAFQPGPGLGGHCLPVDPQYLSWKLRSLEYQVRFVDLADSINRAMPAWVVGRVADALNTRALPVRGSRVLVYGVSYKRDVGDVRESPALDVIAELLQRGASVSYMDPHVPRLEHAAFAAQSVDPRASFADYDVVVVVADHAPLDRERLVREGRLIVDTRGTLRDVARGAEHVFDL